MAVGSSHAYPGTQMHIYADNLDMVAHESAISREDMSSTLASAQQWLQTFMKEMGMALDSWTAWKPG